MEKDRNGRGHCDSMAIDEKYILELTVTLLKLQLAEEHGIREEDIRDKLKRLP